MPECTLNWSSDRGFELDLDAQDDDVALRLAAVPVPADGRAELRAGVDLDRLEILFKAHVDVAGEPGQLVEATVLLVDGDRALTFKAQVEDVETGEILPFTSTHPIRLPVTVPEFGGPRPIAASEDELDWEDETTLEKMIVNAPETTGADDLSPQPEPPGKGIQALLQALAHVDDPQAPEHAPTEPEIDVAALLGAAMNRAPEPIDQQFSEAEVALRLIEMLIDQEGLELEDGHAPQELVDGVIPILAMRVPAERQAAALSNWLLDQPSVADLYIGDDDLAGILEQW